MSAFLCLTKSHRHLAFTHNLYRPHQKNHAIPILEQGNQMPKVIN